MPRFFFDIHDDGLDLFDREGQEHENLASAQNQAAAALGEVARDELPAVKTFKVFTIHVRDEAGRVVLKVALSFAAQMMN